MRPGTSGLELAGAFWAEHVGPALAAIGILDAGAALLGPGSEVLGFDDARSTDHDFGPRLQVFVPADRTAPERQAITDALDDALPETFGGFPVRFARSADPVVRHRVDVTALGSFFRGISGIDPTVGPISTDTWLAASTQSLAELTGGAVFADPTGELADARTEVSWYPDDVWRYVLGCQWKRLAQEEAFGGRAGEVDDDLGSRIVAARLARDLVRLGFLLERRWAPYAKWLGSAFRTLDLAPAVTPALADLLSAPTSDRRQRAYARAARVLAERSNDLGLVALVDPTPRPYHDRPFLVLHAERFADAYLDELARTDPSWPARGWRGAVDQWIDSTDVLGDVDPGAASGHPGDRDLPDRLRRPVTVVAYRDTWPAAFDDLAGRLRVALGPRVRRIDHIGSTAVPELAGKDVIDAQVIVDSLHPREPMVDAFAAIGFVQSVEPWNRRDPTPADWDGPADAWDKLVFAPTDPSERPVNVHVRVDGSPNARLALLFRDHLRARADRRDAWGRFKRELAARVPHLAAYGQVKGPPTEILLADAEAWATEVGWQPPGPAAAD